MKWRWAWRGPTGWQPLVGRLLGWRESVGVEMCQAPCVQGLGEVQHHLVFFFFRLLMGCWEFDSTFFGPKKPAVNRGEEIAGDVDGRDDTRIARYLVSTQVVSL